MGKIELTDIKVYANHGCLPQETIIGSDYLVDVSVEADLTKSTITDNLEDTIDYVLINKIVKDEMAIPSKLLEHVAQRILRKMSLEIPLVKKAMVKVTKINPPIGGDVKGVSITLYYNK